jgi:hypothetical protein
MLLGQESDKRLRRSGLEKASAFFWVVRLLDGHALHLHEGGKGGTERDLPLALTVPVPK